MSPMNKASFNLKAMSLLARGLYRTAGSLVVAAIILISLAALTAQKADNFGGRTSIFAFTAHTSPAQTDRNKKRPDEMKQLPSVIPSEKSSKSDNDQGPTCPSMEMSCPGSVVAGSEVSYTAEWSGGTPNVKPKYFWSVSAGQIIKGQGSVSMTLSTKGVQEKSVKVTLELVGFGRTCSKSCAFRVTQPDEGIVVPVTPKPTPRPTDTPTPKPTDTPTPKPTDTPTPKPTDTPTPKPTPSPSPSPSLNSSPSPTPTALASPTPSVNVALPISPGATPDGSPFTSPQTSPSTTPPDDQRATRNWPWIAIAAVVATLAALWAAMRFPIRSQFRSATDLDVRSTETGKSPDVDTAAAESKLSALILGTKGQTDEDVRCTVFAPHEAAPGDAFLVQAFAHLAEQSPLLAEIAKEADRNAARRGSKNLGEIARGEKLGFYLEMPGLEIDDPSQSLDWLGEIASLEFGVSVPETFKPRSINCKLTVSRHGVATGHIKFNFKVSAEPQTSVSDTDLDPHQNFVSYKLAFISYASADRSEVMRRVQMLDATKIKYFQDLLSLEAGTQWEPVIYRYIDECDVFYLFWSTAAKKSKWVEKEVQRALSRRGDKFDAPPEIIGIPIEGPPPVEPPQYLAAIHFDSKFLYFINPRDDA